MEELDLLKKHWKKSADFPQFSKEDIQKIIHKKSTSIVKWIFIISVIEFSLGIIGTFALGRFITTDELIRNNSYDKFETYSPFITIIFYVILAYFVYRFYQMYRKITVDASTRELMKNILKTRTIVNRYILFNVVVVIGSFLIGGIIGMLSTDYNKKIAEDAILINSIMVLVFIVCSALLAVLVWLFYKLIYGVLLRKLDKNYEELKKIDF